MTTWWDERMARVTEAVDMVARQRACTTGEAIAVLRQRAQLEGTDLEEIAETVLGQQARLGYRDLAASDDEFADTAFVVVT